MNAFALSLNITFTRIAIWFSSSPSRYKLKRIESRKQSLRDICRPMFIAALFTTAKTWKQPKCPWRNEWIKKIWYIHTMGYYSALKRKEILTYAMIWMMWYDWEFVCQCRGQGFDPWSGKISLAAGQLRPCATTTEPTRSNYWSPPGPRALSLWQEKPPQSEVCAGYN